MIANLLRPADYRDPAIFVAELERIFGCAWHLVGLRRDLTRHEDYRLVTVGRREIVLQNFSGEIHAFANVCPHRYGALRTSASGNGALRCPYHLWSFGADGLPAAVPHRGDCPLEHYRTGQFALDRWTVDFAGEFIFIAHRPGQELRAFLGPLFERLATLSRGLGEEIDGVDQNIAANWKIILQNTVEFDHAFSVHAETFATLVERPLQLCDDGVPAPHIAYRAAMRKGPETKPAERRVDGIFARSAIPYEAGYRHYLLFPGTTIGATGNRHFALVTYQPVEPRLTRARCRIFAPQIADLTPVEKAILDQVMPRDIAFTRRLLEEDRTICETVQRGVDNAPEGMAGTLLPGEALVRRFQEFYCAAMAEPPHGATRP